MKNKTLFYGPFDYLQVISVILTIASSPLTSHFKFS